VRERAGWPRRPLADDVPVETAQRALLLESVDQLVRERIEPLAADIDERNVFPWDAFKAMADLGLFAVWVPEEFGGIRTDLKTIVLIAERLARVSPTCALIFSNCGDGAIPIIQAGSDEIKARYLPRIATGEIIPCVAMTEPNAGSDAAAIKTRAVRQNGSYVLNGQKQFCTNGSVGGVYSVFASTDPSKGSHGITGFVIERDEPGFVIGADEKLIGLHGSPTTAITLDNVTLGEDRRLGEEGTGFPLAMATFDDARLTAAAMSLGIARGSMELAVGYARERQAFGKPIIEHQGLAFLLAEITTDMAAGWALLEQATEMLEAGRSRRASVYAAMAKLFCTDLGMRAATEGVQVFGGSGLTRGLPLERMMRDAKAYQIFDGTNQIQKMLIGRYLQKTGLPIEMG
jgi:alkylation response protein AidB-like acyl-CoA dehydrogenase